MNSNAKQTSLLRAVFVVFLSMLVSVVFADWQSKSYHHFSKDEPLIALLQDFSASMSVPILLSEPLQSADMALLNGEISGTGLAVLENLSRVYNLVWYFDHHMLHVSTANENKTLLLTMQTLTPALARQSLEQANIFNARFTWQPIQGVKSVMISGPPRYVELVEQVVKAYDGIQAQSTSKAYTVRVFQLENAWAKDRVVTIRGEKITVPGIATSVQRILARDSNPAQALQTPNVKAVPSDGREFSPAKNGTTGVALKGAGVSGQGLGAKPQAQAQAPQQALAGAGSHGSYVEPSPQQNAVIVYDLASRMPLYESLIKALDVATDQVEIEVSIIDVKTNRLNELGIAWQANGEHGQAGFGQASDITQDTSGAWVQFDDSVNVSTIVSGQVDYFLGKVRALAQDGDGQILSQPTVLTVDNQEALIDNSSTFFVRLQGQEEVDLVPITTGSVLRVTPRIMDKQQRISLNIDIADGERDQQSGVDNIPSISTSRINTQAVVDANTSLLVGGYYYDQQTSGQEKVPILGDIPGLKLLFSNARESRVKVARLFLISPKIITSHSNQSLVAKSNRLNEMVEREKSFYDTKYKQPQLSIFD